MKKLVLLFISGVLSFSAIAQEEAATTVTKSDNWKSGASLGLDLAQLLLINPKVGAGENKIGLGGATGFFANYAKDKWAWDNSAGWQMSVQKLGSSKNSFTKNVDDLKFDSKVGYAITKDKKWFAATALGFRSQVTPTYGANSLSDRSKSFKIDKAQGTAGVVTDTLDLLSKFLAPATFTFTPGIDYKPTEHLSFLLSPASSKLIVVADDEIAALGVHGNEWESATDYENTSYQLGASLTGKYANKYFNDKLIFNTRLFLFSNYLKEAKNVDVEWTTEVGYQLFKGLTLALNAGLYYDHDVAVLVDRNEDGYYNTTAGSGETGRRAQFIEGFNIKYAMNF